MFKLCAVSILLAMTVALAGCSSEETPSSTVPGSTPVIPAGTSAQALFGAARLPALLAGPTVIGTYNRGCLARAAQLPRDGVNWQAMRLSRNRYWGHPSVIAFVQALAARAHKGRWRGLLVGDIGQPRGGPALTGHNSHQIGLDVDIWLTPMPARVLSNDERESMPSRSMLKTGIVAVDPRLFTAAQSGFIRDAAKFDAVARIFVNPAIKKALCKSAGRDRDWLQKVRPWRGHDSHIHVRLHCPAGEPLCREQDAPPPGDGCGAELKSWLDSTDWLPEGGREYEPEPIPMSALPKECRAVLDAPDLTAQASARPR